MDHSEDRVIRLPLRQEAFSADAVFEEMLTGWKQQQLARNFTAETIRGRECLVRRFADHTGHFPWEWTIGDADEFFAHERSIVNLAYATVRAYQTHLKVFCDFLTDPGYEWDQICQQRFGRSPAQIITEFNRARHAQNNEQAPAKRPFTRAELQGFFDLADLEVERVLASGRKGAVAAYRDATVFKTAYAWGLRANEVTHLQTVDLSRNRRAPQFGEFGVLQVRYGKAQRGSPPKRRSVLTVFDWSPDVIEAWIRTGLPWLAPTVSELFPTANGLPVPKSNLRRRFRDYVDELGYPPGLDLHSLRRSYITHLFEHFGFDHTFVQRQVGHEHASTTSRYTAVSSDYQTSELNRVLENMIDKAIAAKEQKTMKREIEYQWRARELMARHGFRNTRELVEPLRERGITLSESQIYRMVSQNPERISFQLLAALCDLFGVEVNELFTFTATDARSVRQKHVVGSGENTARFVDTYQPVRARILDED